MMELSLTITLFLIICLLVIIVVVIMGVALIRERQQNDWKGVYLYEDTTIDRIGLPDCCVKTVRNLNHNATFLNGTILDCPFHDGDAGKDAIILEDGIWTMNYRIFPVNPARDR
jgi:hypothetical protein